MFLDLSKGSPAFGALSDDSGVTSDNSDEWNLKCSELQF